MLFTKGGPFSIIRNRREGKKVRLFRTKKWAKVRREEKKADLLVRRVSRILKSLVDLSEEK